MKDFKEEDFGAGVTKLSTQVKGQPFHVYQRPDEDRNAAIQRLFNKVKHLFEDPEE